MEGHITEDNSEEEQEEGEGEGEEEDEGSYCAIRGCEGLWVGEEVVGLNWSGGAGVEGGGGFVGKKKERKLLMVDEAAMGDVKRWE